MHAHTHVYISYNTYYLKEMFCFINNGIYVQKKIYFFIFITENAIPI